MIIDPRTVEALDVYADDGRGNSRRIGQLERTDHGCEFRYVENALNQELSVSSTLPLREAPYRVGGVNLPPFFAGLLPEGLRMRALVRGVKTSEDDLFTLLAVVGADTVGAVSVSIAGEAPTERAPLENLDPSNELDFTLLLERALDFGAGRGGDSQTLAGVQPKVSAGMISLPLRRESQSESECILKLEPDDLPNLVACEAFFMGVARDVGLDVAAAHFTRDVAGRPGLLVERFDRGRRASGARVKHAQEDACQVLDRYPADKYRVSLREFAEALELCSAPAVERLRLVQQLAFSYLIANGDLHAKNLSVQTVDGITRLTPGYDLLSTLPFGDDSMALLLEGRDKRWKRADLVRFGERVGVRASATNRTITQLVERLRRRLGDTNRPDLESIGLDAKTTRHLARTIAARCDDLDPG